MSKFITNIIIILMLTLFASLGAQSSSKYNKNSSTDKEQIEQTSSSKSNHSDNSQSEKAVTNNSSRADKEDSEPQAVSKTSKPDREEVASRASKPEREQSQPDKPTKPEREQSSQVDNTKPDESAPAAEIHRNPSQPLQTGNVKNTRYNYSKPSQNDNEKLPRLSTRPSQTNAGTPNQFSTSKPDQIENVTPVHTTTTGSPTIQPAYRHVTPEDNHNPPGDDHHGDNNHNDNNHNHNNNNHHHGSGGQHGYPGWYNTYPYDNWGGYANHRGFHDYWDDGYWYPGLTIYINLQDEANILRGYLVDNDWDMLDERSTDLRVGYNPFPFKDIHQHNADCPYGGYGILVQDDDGVYTFFHFDRKGNKLAAALLNKTYSQNKKIRIEITGDISRTKQSIKIWSLDKVSNVRKSYIGRYQIEGIDIDLPNYYFGSYNHLGRFHERHHLWARY